MSGPVSTVATDVDLLAINTVRFLAVDMVERARSGHPGAPLGQAPYAYLLWTRILRHNPANPRWPNRDRFVLSCGHASAMLYALLHLSGYDLPLDELRRFRQLGSRTPGHPESQLTPGVETTTGPLGQGFGNAVGMAIAQRMLAARFNRDGFPVVDHDVWVSASDGDMMEGMASEAASLAGHLGLSRLHVLYDDNGVSIDGPTSLAFSEDVGKRFEAYGWHVQRVADGNDLEALEGAMTNARVEAERPSLIVVRTHIGYGSPHKQDTAEAHGAPLGPEEVKLTKRALGWPLEPEFHVPHEARDSFARAARRGARLEDAWRQLLDRYAEEHPEPAAELRRRFAGDLGEAWEESLPSFEPEAGPMATREASGKVLNALKDRLPLAGGSADLTPSNNTHLEDRGDFSRSDAASPNLRFGVREHAMGAILSGIAHSRAFVPYGGTFLIFSDYMRASIRLAALMGLPVIYVFTHDSIFLGEDGPTHQPVSQLMGLRLIPGLTVFRPADANETAEAWRQAIRNRRGPTALALTRQKLPVLLKTGRLAREGVARGGYVLSDPPGGQPQAILLATGSEVALALESQQALASEGLAARVVSLPSWERFDTQDRAYREMVLPPGLRRRLAIEAGIPLGWERYVGEGGAVLGVERFGASAPYRDLAVEFGFTAAEVARRVAALPG